MTHANVGAISAPADVPKLRRVRWAVRFTLVLGLTVSVVANVLHALDNPISQTIAAWPPLALLLTVELISRIPVHRRSLAVVRLLSTATIAGIAAWVSYWHMVGVASRYGETGASPYLLPLSVDGLVVVASICLVELSGRIRTMGQPEPVGLDHLDYREPAVAELVHDEPFGDPWQWSTPFPEPIREPLLSHHAGPVHEPPSEQAGAERVRAAHAAEPRATNGRIAELAGVSISTVKRHRPSRELATTSAGSR